MTTNCHFSKQIKKQKQKNNQTQKTMPTFYENSDGGIGSFGNQRLMIIADN